MQIGGSTLLLYRPHTTYLCYVGVSKMVPVVTYRPADRSKLFLSIQVTIKKKRISRHKNIIKARNERSFAGEANGRVWPTFL